MITNSDCTVYRLENDNSFSRHYIERCFWQPIDASRVTNTSFVSADSIIVYIPNIYADKAPKNAAKDIIVKGNCTEVNDNRTPEGVREFLKRLRNHDMHTAESIIDKMYGFSLQHVKVVAK